MGQHDRVDGSTRQGQSRAKAGLIELGSVFGASVGGPVIAPDVRAEAYERAFTVLDSMPADGSGDAIAALGLAADLFLAIAVDLAAQLPAQIELIGQIQRTAGITPLTLGRQVLAASRLLLLPTAVAVEVQLTMLLAFSGQRAAAIFTQAADGELRLLTQTGELSPGAPELHVVARAHLAGSPAPRRRVRLAAAVLERHHHRQPAALILSGESAGSSDCALLLEAAIPLLSALLERDDLDRELRTGAAEVATAERRLARLRYDLHDGPQQDVIMMAQDLRLLASQLTGMIDGSDYGELIIGRFDDLQARLVAIDGELRRIAAFVHSPFLKREQFSRAVLRLAEQFAERARIEPELDVQGNFDELTDSQMIALLSLIREALNNIREHSRAQRVQIRLAVDAGGISASVTDDGDGFDPEKMLVQAARDGHLGLVGMYERVRLLGGTTHIDSRPGGPTVISLKLPPAAQPQPQAAADPAPAAAQQAPAAAHQSPADGAARRRAASRRATGARARSGSRLRD
jgi:signal transduction histidine kinase